MERLTILIESTDFRLTCKFNPSDQDDSFSFQRSSGAAREQSGSLTGGSASDDRIVSRGRGDTRLTVKLLFDVFMEDSSNRSEDVRELTRPLWELTEYPGQPPRAFELRRPLGALTENQGQSPRASELRRVRLFWGKSWEIPAVVESVSERYERFSGTGEPQRSWLTLSLMRVNDDIPPAETPSLHPATQMPTLEILAAAFDSNWGVHEKLGDNVQGESLWQIANRYYGDPRLWRLVALANDIADPLKIPAGKLLKIPPLKVLKGR